MVGVACPLQTILGLEGEKQRLQRGLEESRAAQQEAQRRQGEAEEAAARSDAERARLQRARDATSAALRVRRFSFERALS